MLTLLADANYHAESELALLLNIDRCDVRGRIYGLRALDFEIHAESGKHYRLPAPLELLDPGSIVRQLSPEGRRLIDRVVLWDVVDSTNTFLLAAARTGAPKGTVCLAEHQTAGRGRGGRRWVSPPGCSICLSLLWRFEHGASRIAALSLACGVAVMRALEDAGIAGAGLKWPNDILWRERKLGGILVEVCDEPRGGCSAVVGVGLNVHLPAESGELIDQAWIDLERIAAPARPSRNRLIGLLLNEILPVLERFAASGLSPYLPDWARWDCLNGKPVTLRLGGSQIRGKARGIEANGMLLLEGCDGATRTYASGEVSLTRAIS